MLKSASLEKKTLTPNSWPSDCSTHTLFSTWQVRLHEVVVIITATILDCDSAGICRLCSALTFLVVAATILEERWCEIRLVLRFCCVNAEWRVCALGSWCGVRSHFLVECLRCSTGSGSKLFLDVGNGACTSR